MMMTPPPPPPTPPAAPIDQHRTGGCYKNGPAQGEEEHATERLLEVVKSEITRGRTEKSTAEEAGDTTTLILYNPILSPILQCGPVCGLIALVEAAQVLLPYRDDDVTPRRLHPDALLEEAIRLGMTKRGEMFSAFDMQRLAKTCFHCDSKLLDTSDVEATWSLLVDHLLLGNVALIPYDADYNHGPTLRNGHSAHWAVIHGVVIPSMPVSLLGGALKEEGNDSAPDFRVLNPDQLSADTNISVPNKIDCKISPSSCVIAHHGKSMRLAVWNFYELMASNQNLVQVSPKITSSPAGNYIFGDIKTELCSKLVLLEKPCDTLC